MTTSSIPKLAMHARSSFLISHPLIRHCCTLIPLCFYHGPLLSLSHYVVLTLTTGEDIHDVYILIRATTYANLYRMSTLLFYAINRKCCTSFPVSAHPTYLSRMCAPELAEIGSVRQSRCLEHMSPPQTSSPINHQSLNPLLTNFEIASNCPIPKTFPSSHP